MANLENIARPYALAAFEFARDKEKLQDWKAFLSSAAQISKEPSVARLLDNPETQSSEMYALFDGVLTSFLGVFSEEQKNLLRLLAQNDRLNVLHEISSIFDTCVEVLEKISNVRVVTAIDIDAAYRKKLSDALTKRIKREVKLHCEIDPAILGGAIIHIGDHVIDGSIRGKLTRLLEFSLR